MNLFFYSLPNQVLSEVEERDKPIEYVAEMGEHPVQQSWTYQIKLNVHGNEASTYLHSDVLVLLQRAPQHRLNTTHVKHSSFGDVDMSEHALARVTAAQRVTVRSHSKTGARVTAFQLTMKMLRPDPSRAPDDAVRLQRMFLLLSSSQAKVYCYYCFFFFFFQ